MKIKKQNSEKKFSFILLFLFLLNFNILAKQNFTEINFDCVSKYNFKGI